MEQKYWLIPILIALFLVAAFYSPKNDDLETQIQPNTNFNGETTLFQVSTFQYFSKGNYNGIITFEELKNHGDVGIGTSNDLDGEMIELNNTFYQIKSNGTVYIINSSVKTPFALVTFFKPNKTLQVNYILNNSAMQQYLDNSLYSKSNFHAIKIHGVFKHIKARSVPKQNEPYPPLTEVLKNQTIFEFNNINGTMIGFWSPNSVNGIDSPGYHFHFISQDKKSGGHVLEYEPQNVVVEIEYISHLQLKLPQNELSKIFKSVSAV